MHRDFRRLLEEATGLSEFVIAVNLDIRGFSEFSKTVDPLESAQFLKKVYMKLIDEYFSDKTFFKPTGDGLLIVIPYTEKNLEIVIKKTIISCLKVLVDFSSFCSKDPMITFDVPGKIGIGLSRGSACRINSGDKTLDYCGSVLNIASRLMDFARPMGIVFDSKFGIELLPDKVMELFEKDSVYIKGIAEKELFDIYRSKYIRIPSANKQPLSEVKWGVLKDVKKLKKIKDYGPRFLYDLPKKPTNPDNIKVKISHSGLVRGRKRREITASFNFDNFEYYLEAGNPTVKIYFDALAKKLEMDGVKDSWDVLIQIMYPEE